MVYKRKRSGSTYARSVRRKQAYRRRRFTNRLASKKYISRIARKVVLSAAEDKEYVYDAGKSEMYHNIVHAPAFINQPNTNCMPGQGDGDTNRTGDKIIARGYKVHALFGQKYDRPNVTWRVIFVAQRPGLGALSYTGLFKNMSGNGLLDEVNTDRVTVLLQKYIKPLKSSVTIATAGVENSQEFTFTRKFWIPRKMMYRFELNGGYQHQDKEIYMYCLCYDAYGTLTTDNIGYCQVWSKFCYKDP